MTEEQYYQQYLRLMMRVEKLAASKFKKSFDEMWKAAASIVEHGQPREAVNIVARFSADQRNILTGTYSTIAGFIGGMTEETIAGPTKAKLSKSFWDTILNWARTEAAKKIKDDVSKTSKKMIARIVARGIDAGKSNAEIAGGIRKLSVVSRSRANLIARTETHNAAGKAAATMSKTMTIAQEKKWLSAKDERTRAWHQNVNGGEWIDMNAKFDVDGEQMMYPGDSSASPRNVCNCRCAVMYRKKTATGSATPPPVAQQPTPVPVQKPTLAPKPAPVAKPVESPKIPVTAEEWQKVKFKRVKTVQEAVDYARDVLGLDAEGYIKVGYSVQVANSVNAEFLRMRKIFGVKMDVGSIGKTLIDETHLFTTEGSEVLGLYSGGEKYGDGGVVRYKYAGKNDYASFMAKEKMRRKLGIKWNSSFSPLHVIRHELGHGVGSKLATDAFASGDAIALEKISRVQSLYDAEAARLAPEPIYPAQRKPALSFYATTNLQEFMAEAIAGYTSVKSVGGLARQVVAILLE
jgi:hypothetical protein